MTDAASQMNAIYRVQRHIYDASRKYYLLGRDGLIERLDPPPGGRVLEIGCGTGRNLICASEHHPSALFYGIDISSAMLETAQKSVDKADLAHRIKLAQGDATQFSSEAVFGVATFDRVFISYALSMIPSWKDALARAVEAVEPGGSLHIVDFGEQSALPRAFRAGLRSWLRKFSVEPRAELEAEMSRLADRAGADLSFSRPFRDYACRAVMTKAAA